MEGGVRRYIVLVVVMKNNCNDGTLIDNYIDYDGKEL